MTQHTADAAGSGLCLFVRAADQLCALPLEHVAEILRPPVVRALAGAPPFVSGVAVIRGEPVAVVDLAAVLGADGSAPTPMRRFISLNVEGRHVAVAVHQVLGVGRLEPQQVFALPPLLAEAAGDVVIALGMLDTELLVVLRASRLIAEVALPPDSRSDSLRPDVCPVDLGRFRSIVAAQLGLDFDEGRSTFLADVLRRRSATHRQSAGAYLTQLDTPWLQSELDALAQELTVGETYFFRHINQFRAVEEVVLPRCLAAPAPDRRLRILSLGCASGEEAYSLAMLVRGTFAAAAAAVTITGVDVNPAAIARAQAGRYSAWSLRETPDTERHRWFREEGRQFVLHDALRASVQFEQRNLMVDDARFWQDGTCDIVFCRNVIMYFTSDQQQRFIARVARLLCPGGFLFIGAPETLRNLSTDFHLHHTHDTFYYERKDDTRGAPTPHAGSPGSSSTPAGVLADVAATAETWFDAIHRASARVALLTREENAARRLEPMSQDVLSHWDPSVVLELLRTERFADALSVLEALPPESGRDPDALLVRAVLLVHAGQFQEADAVCRHLLDADGLNAGAHYLLALCREGAGDRPGVVHHDQVAAYLDPGFAMPRLHLGLVARRAGDLETARRELAHALVLLRREDAPRVLLFGGGFGREALVRLCQAELLRCGGRP